MPDACVNLSGISAVSAALGGRGLGTAAPRLGLEDVKLSGQAAALAGGRVFVDRALGRGLVQHDDDLLQLGLGLVDVAGGDGGGVSLDLVGDPGLSVAG